MNNIPTQETIAAIKEMKNIKKKKPIIIREKPSKKLRECLKDLAEKTGLLFAANRSLVEAGRLLDAERAMTQELRRRLDIKEARVVSMSELIEKNKLAMFTERNNTVAKLEKEISELKIWYTCDGKTIDELKDLIIKLFEKREMKNETVKQTNSTPNAK